MRSPRKRTSARTVLTRRAFGLAAAVVAATAAVPAGMVPPGLRDLLTGLIKDRETAALLGRAYLAAPGADWKRLTHTAAAMAAGAPDNVAEFRARLDTLRRRDLEADDMVVVDGWVLARAEAEVLALIALA